MLILTRRPGEMVRINDDIVITVLSVKDGYQVRLGFNAPSNVEVHREEIWQKLRRIKQQYRTG